MEVFINNLITFLNGLSPFLKVLLVGLLIMIDVMCVINVIKSCIKKEKVVLNLLSFVLLALFLALSIFIFSHL